MTEQWHEPSLKELLQYQPIRKVLAAVAFVNWLVFFAVSINIGGDAIGTTPSQQGFVVKSHGKETAVTEDEWLFSLYYPLGTLTLTPLFILPLAATQLKIREKRRYFILIIFLAWATGWYYALIRDGSHSIIDYLNLNVP